jgi:hypothetical protein
MCARVGVLRVLGMVVGQVASRVRKSHRAMSVTPIARRGVSWEFHRADAAVATASQVQANVGPEGKLRRRVQVSDVPRPATTAVAVGVAPYADLDDDRPRPALLSTPPSHLERVVRTPARPASRGPACWRRAGDRSVGLCSNQPRLVSRLPVGGCLGSGAAPVDEEAAC